MIVDLFAGCGGWDVGARLAGLPDPVGFELDAQACATRVAAGMPTVRADLTDWPLAQMAGKVGGLIASPPCTDFSAAGDRAGREGDTGHLVDVPLWWALELQPEWIAWEQVPPVLPIWREHAYELERVGYRCWTGILCAADYGVPQTRRRAILLARKDRRPVPPMHTHDEIGGLFTEQWVSMADALGWTEGRVGFPRLDDTGTSPDGYRERDWRGVDEPAGVLTEKARSWVLNTGRDWKPGGTRDDAQRLTLDRPAPSFTAKSGEQWQLRSGGIGYPDGGNRRPYDADEPAPTIAFGNDAASWCWERPATTVAGDPRITARCHHDEGSQGANATDVADVAEGRYDGTSAIKLTIRDALILQSFPPDFPVQGNRTAQFRQVGNAMPPVLAARLLEAVQ